MTYSDLLRDPRWQRKRLEIMQRAGFACEVCGATTVTLNVHHVEYVRGRMPWDYPDEELQCLCENCHGPGEGRREIKPTPKEARRRLVGARASSAERELVRVLLHKPAFLEQVVERVGDEDFHDDQMRSVFAALRTLGAEAGVYAIADLLDAWEARRCEQGHASRGDTDLLRELLKETGGLERADEAVAGSLAAMHQRSLAERMAAIDHELPGASEERKDALVREKMALTDEIRRLGGRWWKRFR